MEIQKPEYKPNTYIFDTVKTSVSKEERLVKSQVDLKNEEAVEVSISEEGYLALREALEQSDLGSAPYADTSDRFEKGLEEAVVKDGSKEMQVIRDLWSELREVGGQELEKRNANGANLNVEDWMVSAMSAYETVYNRLVEKHKEGDRWLSYGELGVKCMNLKEDLAALDEAYKLYTGQIEAFVGIQQTNKHAEQKYYREYKYLDQQIRKHRGDEITISGTSDYQDDGYNYIDKDYNKTLKSIMKEGMDRFLKAVNTSKYTQGVATGIMIGLINDNQDFVERTKKLFSK